MKKLLVVLLIALAALGFMACPAGSEGGDSAVDLTAPAEGDMIFWSFTDELVTNGVIADYEAKYPDVTIEFTQIPTNEFVAKTKPVLATGEGAPDIFTGEAAFVKEWVEGGVWEDIGVAPYNALDKAKGKIAQYVLDMATDDTGALRGLSWQSTAGALMYNRDIAEAVLGTDDPDEVSKYTGSWDGYIELGQMIKDKFGGTKWLVADANSSVARLAFQGRSEAYIQDGKFVLDQKIIDFMDKAKEMREMGLDAGYGQWSPEWAASMANGEVFSYILPTWGLHYVLVPNAGEEMSGHYGLASSPESYAWGGTWLGIYVNATPQAKNNAWKMIEMFCLDDDYMEAYAKKTGDFLSNLKVVEKIKDSADFDNPFLAGQNHYAYFYDQAQEIDTSMVTGKDNAIEQILQSAIGSFLSGDYTKDEAIAEMKAQVSSQLGVTAE